MAEKRIAVPEILPLLPVRDTVLFPGAVLPLTVGRETSLALVNSLNTEEKYIGVVAQLDPRVEDPSAADLHNVGTMAKVHKTVKMPNGNVVVFLEGIARFRVDEVIGFRPFLRARVVAEPDILGERDSELEALHRNAQEMFRDVVSHSPQLSDELQSVASSYQSPVAYPKNNGLANQLKLVAQVIAGNLGTRLFSVSMGGFDTHADQKDHCCNTIQECITVSYSRKHK